MIHSGKHEELICELYPFMTHNREFKYKNFELKIEKEKGSCIFYNRFLNWKSNELVTKTNEILGLLGVSVLS